MKKTESWKNGRSTLTREFETGSIPTAKRLRNKPQVCRAATTLGSLEKKSRNPNRVAGNRNAMLTQGSRQAATLGFVAQPLRGCSLLILILTLSMFASAQSLSSITGRVTDQHDANVAGAEVQLRSRSGVQSFAPTDDNGAYSFKNVPSGDYVIEVRKKGFAGFTSKALSIARGKSLAK